MIGTLGQVPEGTITLVDSLADVDGLDFPPETPLAFLTQTTLSVDDTAEIVVDEGVGIQAVRTAWPLPLARARSWPSAKFSVTWPIRLETTARPPRSTVTK